MKRISYLISTNIIHKLIVALIFFILCLATAVAVEVADSNKKIEIKKAAIIKIMKQGKFNAYIQKDHNFCASFLNDFTEQKGIEYIKPIIEVDDYNDPKLQAYFKQCPNKKFNKSVEISHARTLEEISGKEHLLGRPLTEDELEEYGGIVFYATKNFKLYKVDICNNKRNDEDFVLYAEGYYNNEIKQYTDGGYTILDLEQCKIKCGTSTKDPFDYKKQQPIDNYNGIIKYKGEYYIFDLREEIGRRLMLEKYNNKRGNMTSVCRYSLQK